MESRTLKEILARDIFPAEVYAPHVSPSPNNKCRVFVTTERVQVWVEENKAPKMLLDEPLVEAVKRDRGTGPKQMTIKTARGLVHVTREGGCGCGSSLKALSAPVGW